MGMGDTGLVGALMRLQQQSSFRDYGASPTVRRGTISVPPRVGFAVVPRHLLQGRKASTNSVLTPEAESHDMVLCVSRNREKENDAGGYRLFVIDDVRNSARVKCFRPLINCQLARRGVKPTSSLFLPPDCLQQSSSDFSSHHHFSKTSFRGFHSHAEGVSRCRNPLAINHKRFVP